MDPMLVQLLTPLLQIVGAALLGVGTWALSRLATHLGIASDDAVRGYLEDALRNALAFGEKQVAARLAGKQPSPVDLRVIETEAVAYVMAHVPDALARFKLTPEAVERLVRARLDGLPDAPLPHPVAEFAQAAELKMSRPGGPLLALLVALPLLMACTPGQRQALLGAAPAVTLCLADQAGEVLAVARTDSPDEMKAVNALVASGNQLLHDAACQAAIAAAAAPPPTMPDAAAGG